MDDNNQSVYAIGRTLDISPEEFKGRLIELEASGSEAFEIEGYELTVKFFEYDENNLPVGVGGFLIDNDDDGLVMGGFAMIKILPEAGKVILNATCQTSWQPR